MPSTGYIQIRAYESLAQLPLPEVSIAILAHDGTALALRLTDEDGKTEPIAIPTPDAEESLTPEGSRTPFAAIDLYAEKANFVSIKVEDVQLFPGVTTLQELEMIPLSELPDAYDRQEILETRRQNL